MRADPPPIPLKKFSARGLDKHGYIDYIEYINRKEGDDREMGKTVERPKRPIYPLDIDPELRKRIKAVASLHGKTMREWVTEAILEKLEDDVDAREGLAVLGEVEGTISLKDYLESRKESQRV